MPQYRTIDDIELGSNEFWMRPLDERNEAFAALRAEDDRGGMCFHEEVSIIEGGIKGPGFWSAVTYDDVRTVSRNPKVFSSASGITFGEQPPDTLEFFGSMIVMDDPRHAKFRLLVQKGFTPKTVATVEKSVRDRARQLVAAAKETGGSCDFVERFAAPLPLQVICDMLGVPPEDEQQIFEWTNVILGAGDPDFTLDLEGLIMGAAGMFDYAQALGEERLASPTDDITSVLMHAELDGQRLTPAEFGSFFILLAVAGNETTRNAISWGMHQLTKHPDQRELLRAEFDDIALQATDEIVRWSSPVIHMRRTANEDVTVGNTRIGAGEKVAMFYWSANRDGDHFPDGNRFDITRPNTKEMAGYGSGGPHFCLGANLARREIQVMLEEIFRELPDLEITGEPDRLVSGFINGVKRMPCEFTVS